jgi:hypothetical protein
MLSSRLAWQLSLIACLVVGCGSEKAKKKVYPVTGVVTHQGKAVANAQVVFHKEGDDMEIGTRPNGRTKEDGSYSLNTYLPGDGAPAGTYKVVIIFPKATSTAPVKMGKGRFGEEEEATVSAGPLAMYLDPKTSKLEAVVKESPNTIDFKIP